MSRVAGARAGSCDISDLGQSEEHTVYATIQLRTVEGFERRTDLMRRRGSWALGWRTEARAGVPRSTEDERQDARVTRTIVRRLSQQAPCAPG